MMDSIGICNLSELRNYDQNGIFLEEREETFSKIKVQSLTGKFFDK